MTTIDAALTLPALGVSAGLSAADGINAALTLPALGVSAGLSAADGINAALTLPALGVSANLYFRAGVRNGVAATYSICEHARQALDVGYDGAIRAALHADYSLYHRLSPLLTAIYGPHPHTHAHALRAVYSLRNRAVTALDASYAQVPRIRSTTLEVDYWSSPRAMLSTQWGTAPAARLGMFAHWGTSSRHHNIVMAQYSLRDESHARRALDAKWAASDRVQARQPLDVRYIGAPPVDAIIVSPPQPQLRHRGHEIPIERLEIILTRDVVYAEAQAVVLAVDALPVGDAVELTVGPTVWHMIVVDGDTAQPDAASAGTWTTVMRSPIAALAQRKVETPPHGGTARSIVTALAGGLPVVWQAPNWAILPPDCAGLVGQTHLEAIASIIRAGGLLPLPQPDGSLVVRDVSNETHALAAIEANIDIQQPDYAGVIAMHSEPAVTIRTDTDARRFDVSLWPWRAVDVRIDGAIAAVDPQMREETETVEIIRGVGAVSHPIDAVLSVEWPAGNAYTLHHRGRDVWIDNQTETVAVIRYRHRVLSGQLPAGQYHHITVYEDRP